MGVKSPIAIFAACTACALGQPAENKNSFDVASVKVTQYRRPAEGPSFSDVKIAGPGKLVAINASLDECIRWAYHLKEYQVSGADWLRNGGPNYDIEAKAPPSTPRQQIRLMLQALLAERFSLRVHHESRTLPVYELVLAKNGAKLHEAIPEGRSGFYSEGGRDGVRMTSQKATMAAFANWLAVNVDRPVIDKTELTGFFAIELEWAREGDGPSVFSAIQEQLGLRLQASKAPIDILIVDHVEKTPIAN
jgi:uncharacterized protein (TIGR03435 family)